eukprot:gene13509-13634_t
MAGQEFVPDFWRYYGNKTLSDVKLVIREELSVAGTRGKRKKPLEAEIVAHGIVLSSFSNYCRTKLEAWIKDTDQSDDKQQEILMPVPEGQLDIGQLLVKCMYQQRADLAGIDQVKLIHLLLLADRYEVPAVQAAVSAAFCDMPLADWQWDTAMMVYALPAGCTEIDACKDLYVTASAKVQQQLGDLEMIWSAFQLYLLHKDKDKAIPGPSHTWQAVATSPKLIISTSSNGGSGSRSNLMTVVQPNMNTVIGFHAKAHLESANALRQMTCTFSAETFKQGCPKICCTGRRSVMLTGRNDLWGYKSFIELGHCSCWADAEMCLRQRGLVGNDSCLHLKLQVLEIL